MDRIRTIRTSALRRRRKETKKKQELYDENGNEGERNRRSKLLTKKSKNCTMRTEKEEKVKRGARNRMSNEKEEQVIGCVRNRMC